MGSLLQLEAEVVGRIEPFPFLRHLCSREWPLFRHRTRSGSYYFKLISITSHSYMVIHWWSLGSSMRQRLLRQ